MYKDERCLQDKTAMQRSQFPDGWNGVTLKVADRWCNMKYGLFGQTVQDCYSSRIVCILIDINNWHICVDIFELVVCS
jgi:hypothetical protein